jgi:hypothetical protein
VLRSCCRAPDLLRSGASCGALGQRLDTKDEPYPWMIEARIGAWVVYILRGA